jgi:serine/threonine protein kinase
LADDKATSDIVATEHLDSCPECRLQLTRAAAHESWWAEAQTLLSGFAEPRWQPDLSITNDPTSNGPDNSATIDEHVRELLGAPHHPEMFGRLGRYDIERVIGHGGMGIVLKAHDSELNRPIAIKLLAGHLAHVGAARERFAREGRAAAAVVHEHVVAIYNVESNERVPYLVMQYVPGRSLQARVDEDGPLGTEEILRIGMQAASGLAAAHRQGLVHRDVKPSNILLEDTVERAVLTDFGLARTFDDASLTHTGILAGTPHYMSPEQATGEPIDQRSDLFSLGAVLYFMATGHPPFRAASAMAVLHRICHDTHRPVWQQNHTIPDAMSDVIDRLLEKKSARRYSSADEVQQELAALLSRLQQGTLGRRRLRIWNSRKARRNLLLGAAAVTAIAATVTATIAMRNHASPGPAPRTDKPAETVVAAASAAPAAVPEAPSVAAVDEAAFTQSENEFRVNWQRSQLDVDYSTRESYFLQDGDDPWLRELRALQHDMAAFESTSTSISE